MRFAPGRYPPLPSDLTPQRVGDALRWQCEERKMDNDRRAFKEAWDYRVAVRRFESAFEAAERLAAAERQVLLGQVARLLLQHIRNVPSEEDRKSVV